MSPTDKALVAAYLDKGGAINRLPETHGESFRKRAIVGHAKRESLAFTQRVEAVRQILEQQKAPISTPAIAALLGLNAGELSNKRVLRALETLCTSHRARQVTRGGTGGNNNCVARPSTWEAVRT